MSELLTPEQCAERSLELLALVHTAIDRGPNLGTQARWTSALIVDAAQVYATLATRPGGGPA